MPVIHGVETKPIRRRLICARRTAPGQISTWVALTTSIQWLQRVWLALQRSRTTDTSAAVRSATIGCSRITTSQVLRQTFRAQAYGAPVSTQTPYYTQTASRGSQQGAAKSRRRSI